MVGYTIEEGVCPDKIFETLNSLVNRFRAGQDSVRVQPAQISFVHCSLNPPKYSSRPIPESMLFFSDSSTVISEKEKLREYLLFYHYSEGLLEVYGHLTFQEYFSQYQESFVSILDIDRPSVPLCYPLSSESVSMIRAFKPYYQLPDRLPDLSESKLSDLVLESMRAVVGLVASSPHQLSVLSAEQREVYLRRTLIFSDPNYSVGFAYALLVAGIDSNFYRFLIERETLLLSVRLDRIWTDERTRTVFCNQWFPGLVTARAISDPCGQYIGFPFPDLLGALSTPSTPMDRHFAEQCKSQLRLDQPMPGLIFEISPTYRASMTSTMPLSHYELPLHLPACLEKMLRIRVETLRRDHSLAFYRPIYIPRFLCFKRTRPDLIDVLDIESRYYKSVSRTQVEYERVLTEKIRLSPDLSYLYPLFEFDLVREVIFPELLSYDGIEIKLDAEYDSGESLLRPAFREIAYEENAEVTHPIPESRIQLIGDYAARYWPPCLRRLLEKSIGDVHLIHIERTTTSAMLRAFGYNRAQAARLWEFFFTETDVYTGNSEEFFRSEYGRVINNDYDKNKKGVCGNCKTLATNGLCPFGDIEDAGRLCSEELAKTTGKNQKYPINHPAQYFRRSL